MNIYIFAEGGIKIGIGHIKRTLILAKELSKNNNVFYICRDKKENLYGIEKLTQEGMKTLVIRSDNFMDNMCLFNGDLLIIDNYDIDEKFIEKVKKSFRKIMIIDDLNRLSYYDVDILLNYNIYADEFNYNTNAKTKLLLGPKYLLINPLFKTNKKNFKKVKDVLITVGGSDINNVTELIVESLCDFNYNFHVVIGPFFNNKEWIHKYLDKENIKFYHDPDMVALAKKVDLAISSCGSTVYELILSQVPLIGIIVADNQKYNAKKLKEIGIINYCVDYIELQKNVLMDYFISLSQNIKLREKQVNFGLKLINSNGIDAIVKEIISIL